MATIKNSIDIRLQAAATRTLYPTNDPVPNGVTVTDYSNGTRDITLTWDAYIQGSTSADAIGILWNESPSAIPGAPTLASNSGYIVLPIESTSYTFKGVPPNRYYKAGIVAAKYIDYTNSHSNVVCPSTTPNWEITASTPNYTGNINGTAASTIATYASNAYAGTVKYRTAGAPTNDPSPTSATVATNTVGGRNIRLDWGAYTQGANQADFLLLFYKEGSGTPSVNDACIVFNVNTASSSYHIFANVDATKTYTAGIAAGRRTENGVEVGAIQTIGSWTVTGTTANNTATSADWSVILGKPSTVYNSNDAASMGVNPTFSAWTGTYPSNWSNWTGSAPTKETSIVRVGDYSVRYTASGGNLGMRCDLTFPTIDAKTAYIGSVDCYLTSVTSGLPGLIIDVYGGGGFGTLLNRTLVQPPSSTTGSWQKIPFTVRGDGSTSITGIVIFMAASFTGFASGAFTGGVIFDNIQYSAIVGDDIDNKKQKAIDIQGQIDGSTQILNASLTAAKTAIAGINASTGNIAASQASVIQGFFGTLSALNANLGTVTAGTLDTTGYGRFRGAVSVSGYSAALVANDAYTQQIGTYSFGNVWGVVGTSNYSLGAGVAGSNTSSTGTGVQGSVSGGKGVYGTATTTGGVGVQADGTGGAKALYCTGGIADFDSVANFNSKITFGGSNAFKLEWTNPGSGSRSVTNYLKLTIDATDFYIPLCAYP